MKISPDEGWVIDQEALFTSWQMGLIEPGDEVWVARVEGTKMPLCWPPGLYVVMGPGDERHPVQARRPDRPDLVHGGFLHRDHFYAWRPKRGQHS